MKDLGIFYTITGTLVTIAGTLVSVYFANKANRKQQQEDGAIVNLEKDDFDKLLSKIRDKQRKTKIRYNLQKIKDNGFNINVYEVQTETEPDNGQQQQRHLSTLCSNYKSPKGTTIWTKPGKYKGQTPYAFIKNRHMWITTKKGNCLYRKWKISRYTDKYIDEWSDTPSNEIPEFWALGSVSRQIRTSVILPLRLPTQTIANFGFIDFESVQYITMNRDLSELFEEIAIIFALDYVENTVEQAKQQESNANKGET
ncbi:MAG: hypothetical protein LBF59_06630 [Prevotellaceae bacterium]|jgi:hypothetical protein|nr:hypothetical protein [Prevotellaceae bacterium]